MCDIMFLFSSFVVLSSLPYVLGYVGPSTELVVVNKMVAPDGFNRSYV